VSLQDVIQMECLNRNSSLMKVNAGEWQGKIFIKEGAIVHSEAADRNGEAALNKILSLRGGEFSIHPFEEPPRQTIDSPWEFLLMEAARAQDEAAGKTPEEPPMATPFAAPPPPPAPLPMPRPAPPVRPPVAKVAPVPSVPVAKAAPTIVKTPATVAPEALPTGSRPARIDEMVVCSPKGEVLYEWQCANTGDRISFLEFISRKSTQLGEGLNLGAFDRLEMEGDHKRVIAQLKKDRGLFVHATTGAARP